MSDEQDFIKALLDPLTQEAAFRKLIAQYQRPLYQHVRNIVLDHDDAHDVLQNTFIKIFRSLNGFKQESRLFTWVYRIATNEALTFLSAKARRSGVSNPEMIRKQAESLKADSYFDSEGITLKLQQAVASLPEKQQLVFRMKYYEEMRYEQISEILGTSVGALKASYFHAAKKIEEYMGRD